MQSILTPPNLYTISFDLPAVKYKLPYPSIVIRRGYSDVEDVKSRFVPVPKIKKTPLRWYRCGSCMCVGTLKRRENVARRTMFPRLAPSLCKLKKEITPLMREKENACREKRKEN